MGKQSAQIIELLGYRAADELVHRDDLVVFATNKEKKGSKATKEAKDPIATHFMGHPVYGTPVMANGTMYIQSMNRLFAIADER